MRRLLQDEGKQAAAGIAGQDGFTLVELLVAMLVGLIVLGTGTYGLARAFNQSNEVTARTASANQAEMGFQQLTRDLRNATVCPTYNGTNTLGGTSVSPAPVLGVLVSAGPTIQLCDPAPGSHATQPPALALVTWTCNASATVQSCKRTFAPILCPAAVAATGACTSGSPTLGTANGSTNVAGISSMTVSGIVGGVTQSNLLADSACIVNSTYYSYGLATSSTCPISWVGLQAQVQNLLDPGNPSDAANQVIASKTSPVAIQTGANLRNYGL